MRQQMLGHLRLRHRAALLRTASLTIGTRSRLVPFTATTATAATAAAALPVALAALPDSEAVAGVAPVGQRQHLLAAVLRAQQLLKALRARIALPLTCKGLHA